jgi:hypothetical protein
LSAFDLSDESLLRYYDSIRKQVEADKGNRHKFMASASIQEYAESLRLELYKRRLSHAPIDWGRTDQQTDTVTLFESNDHDGDSDPVVVEAPTVEAAEEAAAQPAEAPKIGGPDPVENDLQRRIDALMKGGAEQTSDG